MLNCLTGGKPCKYAAIAAASSLVSCERAAQGITGASTRPSGPDTGGEGCYDLRGGSVAQPGFLVWRKIPASEDASAGNCKPDIRAAQAAAEVGVTQQGVWRVAIIAAA